jgi:hypothetical protein
MSSKAVIITSFVIFIICFTVIGLILGSHITSNRFNKDIIEKRLEVDRKAFEALGIEPEQIEIALKAKEQEYKGNILFSWTGLSPIIISIGALLLSGISLGWKIWSELAGSRTRLDVWQYNNFFLGSEDDRTEINLLFRNKGNRPTSVFELYMRKGDGSIIKGHGYGNKVELPIQIAPWGVEHRKFRIEKVDEKEMKDILMRDIDDNEIIYDRKAKGDKWDKCRVIKMKKKKIHKKK